MVGKRPIQEIGKQRWVTDLRKRPSGPEIDSIDAIASTHYPLSSWVEVILDNPRMERPEVRDGRSNKLTNWTEK